MIEKPKAKVEILQKRIAGKNVFIEADVEIKGITNRKRFQVPVGASNEEVKKIITTTLVEQENVDNVGLKFEVQL